jgi:uncharacterized protein YeaO (DUF488 family)
VTLRIVRLGEPRDPQEGTRIGTVRRPPRGVRKERYAPDDWFDVWFPDLAPSAQLMAQGQAAVTETEWKRFVRAFKAEMNVPTARRERGPLPPVCASRTTDGPRREPRVAAAATAEALVVDGQDSVPHADRPATYIPLVVQNPS